MARIKNKIRPIKRRGIIFLSMFLSFCVFIAIIAGLLYLRDADFIIFKNETSAITGTFESVEREYGEILNQLTTKRTAVATYRLDNLEKEYTILNQTLGKLNNDEASASEIDTIRAVIQSRIGKLAVLREMNAALSAEEIVGTNLRSYENCKKDINYRQKAGTVKRALITCKYNLTTAQSNTSLLPKSSYAHCVKVHVPEEIIKKNITTVDYLISYYDLLGRGKARDAAAMDLKYRSSLAELKKLPSWNTCISSYLQETTDSLY